MIKVVHVFTVSDSMIFLEGLYERLRSNNIQLIVICSDGKEARLQEKIGNIKYYPVEIFRGINPLMDIISLFYIVRILIKEKPLIIHGHTPKGGFLAMLAGYVLNIKNRLYHLHGLKYPSEKGIIRILIKLMEKMTLTLSTRVFSVSDSLLRYAIKENLVNEEKITVILNGSIKGIDSKQVDLIIGQKTHLRKKLGIIDKEIVFCFVGRVIEEKGIFDLLSAFNKATKIRNNIGLIICGQLEINSKEDLIYFNDLIKSDEVQYFGSVSNPLEFMASSDIFVLPSKREGFGLVNLEANSVGVPVITTNIVGCMDSIEDGFTGFLVDKENQDELYEKMLMLADNKSLRERLGKNGITRAKSKFDRGLIWNELISIYRSL